MIRYKKKLQQGGAAPASAYAQGAQAIQTSTAAGAASAAAAGPGPYQRVPMQPNPSDPTGSTGGGGGLGRQLMSNIASKNPIASKILPNLAKMRNEELRGEKEAMMKLYSSSPKYFDRGPGLQRLNAYKEKEAQYKNEIGSLELVKTEALKRSAGNRRQVALTNNNKLFVKDNNGRVVNITVDEYIKDLNQEGEDRNFSKPMTTELLLASMDDTNQYSGEKVSQLPMLIGQAVENTVDHGKVSSFIKSNIKNKGKASRKNNGIQWAGLANIEDFDVTGYDGGIPGDDSKSLKTIHGLVNEQIDASPIIAKSQMQLLLKDPEFLSKLQSSSNPQSDIENEVRKRVWNIIVGQVQPDTKTPEAIAEDKKAQDDIQQAVGKDPFLAAQTNWGGTAERTPAYIEDVFIAYDVDGNKKKPTKKQTDLGLSVNVNVVAKSSGLIADEYDAKTTGENARDKDKIKLTDFKTIDNRTSIKDAVLADGTRVADLEFAETNGFLPIRGEDMKYITMPIDARTGKMVPWATGFVQIASETYKSIKEKAEGDRSQKNKKNLSIMKYDINSDGNISHEEMEQYVNSEMSKVYPELLARYDSPLNNTADIPKSYEDLMNMEFGLKGFFMLDVVGELKDSYEGTSVERLVKQQLTNNASDSVEEYEMDPNTMDINTNTVQTTIFLPEHGLGSGETDWGSRGGATAVGLRQRRKSQGAGLKIQDLLKEQGTDFSL